MNIPLCMGHCDPVGTYSITVVLILLAVSVWSQAFGMSPTEVARLLGGEA